MNGRANLLVSLFADMSNRLQPVSISIAKSHGSSATLLVDDASRVRCASTGPEGVIITANDQVVVLHVTLY